MEKDIKKAGNKSGIISFTSPVESKQYYVWRLCESFLATIFSKKDMKAINLPMSNTAELIVKFFGMDFSFVAKD